MASSSSRRRSTLLCLLVSALLHVGVLFGAGALSAGAPRVALELPEQVEFGLLDEEPGQSGGPPPAAVAAAAPKVAPVVKRAPRPKLIADAPKAASTETAASEPSADSEAEESAADAPADSAGGEGQNPYGYGPGSGFGSAGFGSGRGGPPGAIIALHADLDSIRRTSLILEVSALLDIVPEWQSTLAGSGFDALNDFARVFVATPTLRRADLVLSARLKGGEPALRKAVAQLAAERGKPAAALGARLWPWHDRGPTERVVGLFSADQFVIARPADVNRVLGVSAALARRHERQPGMERAAPPASLLAMYEGEAMALSVEGVRAFLASGLDYAPQALRLSLRHIDEFYARLIAYGYYASAADASLAKQRLEALRPTFAGHPRTTYLGLRSAIEEAVVEQSGSTLTVEARLTMHQTRYLLGFVRRALIR